MSYPTPGNVNVLTDFYVVLRKISFAVTDRTDHHLGSNVDNTNFVRKSVGA
jgi:hypothetical protein